MPKYAAIDIGSNSVRMLAAEVEPGGAVRALAEDRQVTRLGESVFLSGEIDEASMALTLSTLGRMTNIYRQHNVLAARVVATSAVRDAQNQAQFLERASAIAGQPVELISGQEEARLIHLGVESKWTHPNERLLIIDIGGGSAEVMEAENGHLKHAFSRPLGAVRLQSVFLKSDPPSRDELSRLEEFIEQKLSVAAQKMGSRHFDLAIGTAATASAVVCAANRIPRVDRELADRKKVSTKQLRRLYRALSKMDVASRRKVEGLGYRRAEIILPGVAVLLRTLETFGLSGLSYCDAGVRDGIIRDLADRGAGRERARLNGEQREMVEQFARRFGVDLKHARRVAHFSLELFHALANLHQLAPDAGPLLEAAAYLRDVGHAISDASHHKHSLYIVSNADLGGFTDIERLQVAMLCRYHRKSMPVARHGDFMALPPECRRSITLLAPLLRIADALDRSREQRVEEIECTPGPDGVMLKLMASEDTGLEKWAVEGAAGAFRQVYETPLIVENPAL
ncbi:MAG: Ppx/GppA phosphatase family protein [Bryobacteraceae bacterium]|nr:Ppx/GppA phosphatase family protein [Bryobacteraceae bacterium]